MATQPGLRDRLQANRLIEALRGSPRRELAIGVALLVAAVGGFAGPAVLGLDSPAVAAQAYISGLARSDASMVAGASEVRMDLAGPVDATLLDEHALGSALANQVGRPTSIHISDPTVDGNLASVQASYRIGDTTRHLTLNLERVFPILRLHGAWKVRVVPALLQVAVPPAAGDLTVDGISVRLPTGKAALVAVFPGDHIISTTGGSLIAGQSVPLVAAGPSTQKAIALKLTPAGVVAAAKAVSAAFASCSGQTSPAPAGCPQTYSGQGSSSLSWTLVGDPNSGAALKVDPTTGFVQLFGHYQMVATSGDGDQVAHRPSSGGYALQLQPAGATFKSGPITSATVPAATRPAAAADQPMLDLVRAALAKCGRMTVASPPDCPQTIGRSATNVSWSLQGDPMTGSAVSFDPEIESFLVAGRVTLGYQYDTSLLGIALHNEGVSEYPFTAHLFWDGKQPILVTIFGSPG
jgi:hypothetical protein